MYLDGSSWQERYFCDEIYTLRCRIIDKPGMLGRVILAIGECGGHVGDVHFAGLCDETKSRDITVFCDSEKLKTIMSAVNAIDGAVVENVVDEVFETHRRGAIETFSRMPIQSLSDLRMVYTPGVASVCKKIEKDPETAWEWTGICDRVAIVTNGTAVLGLGDIGSLASLPVMEGKAAIFAEFTGISAVPVLVDSKDVDTIVETVALTAGSYGAIQLEDIAAPACFEIEEKLRARLDILVLHDDQHGTATITLAALITALKQTNRKAEDCSAIILGAGAAGIAISKILLDFGIKDILVYDSAGAVYKGRTKGMNKYKEELAEITNKDCFKGDLLEGFKGRDIFIGVAQPKMVSKEMIAAMADGPIAFPLSNPVGEISREEAAEAGAAVTADGRGINNALAYPGLFRGALNGRAKKITLKMQIAAAKTIAELAPEGRLLPDILDRGVHMQVADAVEEAI
ncbi:MAG: NAD-dependent malic enzyme [Phycisphaerae bacterium]|nr:NAD-dependent malic enzyme [Phycisphaerae bacterium]